MLGDKRLPSRSGSEHPLAATVARDFYVVCCCCRRGYWGGPVSGVSTSRTCSACPRGSVIRTAGTPSRRARHGDARWCENLLLAGRRFRCRVLPLSVGEGVEVPHPDGRDPLAQVPAQLGLQEMRRCAGQHLLGAPQRPRNMARRVHMRVGAVSGRRPAARPGAADAAAGADRRACARGGPCSATVEGRRAGAGRHSGAFPASRAARVPAPGGYDHPGHRLPGPAAAGGAPGDALRCVPGSPAADLRQDHLGYGAGRPVLRGDVPGSRRARRHAPGGARAGPGRG